MSKVLVAYFSASAGKNTEKVAKTIAEASNGDLFEITPKTLYTREDLNWNNKQSRSSVEMNDDNSRPEISGNVKNIEEYDTVFLGFPVWWYIPPRIIQTFVENNDLKGKKVITFVTSGGSGVEGSSNFLINNYKGIEWVTGKRFRAGEKFETIRSWVETV